MQVGWLWVSATAKSQLLQTTKFLLPYATKLPTSPSHATLRTHLGRFPSCSRWGPQKKGLQGLAAPPFSAGGGRKRAAWRHRVQFPGPRLALKWEKAGKPAWRSRTCIVPRCHSEEAFRASHLEGDPLEVEWGFEGETLHAEVTFGCSGAGRSCPFSTRRSAASPNVNEAPRQNLSGSFPEVSVFPDFRILAQNEERQPIRPTSTPLPLCSTRFSDIKLRCPHDAATKPGRCKRSWRNPSFHTGRLASSHLRDGKEGGGKSGD